METEEIKIELEQSDYIKERNRLWALYETPTISQARINLGEELARLIFEQCEQALRKEFGLEPPLEGAGDVLWSSPSDLLLGKLALKPPYTTKCLQALTHQCVLDLGYEIEGKFRHELELEMQKALEKQKIELQRDLEDQLRFEIKDVEIRERLHCQMRIEKLMQEFEQTLVDELEKLESRLRVEYEYVVRTHEQQIKEKWQRNLDLEVQNTIEAMSAMFFKKLEQQEAILSKNFKYELKTYEIRRNVDIKLEQQKYKSVLVHLRHSLECRNIANMMFVLCMERRKCCEEKTALETYYKGELQKMQSIIDEKVEKIKTLKKEKETALNNVKLRETCLTEILKQYQKFINFALRAAPTQAEFLLSIEKMMVFELNEAATKSNFAGFLSTDNLLPWREDPVCPSEVSDITVDDFHDCYKVLNPPLPDTASELGPDDYLPAVYFKNKMYMREDFRNMLSQGIEVTRSNELWNKDVEILLETMKSLTSVKSDEMKSIRSSFKGSHKNLLTDASTNDKLIELKPDDNVPRPDDNLPKMSVPLVVFDTSAIEETTYKRSLAKERISRESTVLKPIKTEPEINYSKIGEHERHKSIISTRDSLDILRDKGSVKQINLDTFLEELEGEGEAQEERFDSFKENEFYQTFRENIQNKYPSLPNDGYFQPTERLSDDLTKAQDSIILRRASLAIRSTAEFSASPKDSIDLTKDAQIVKQKSSKLTSARNSIEILRESLMKLRQPSEDCRKKPGSSHMSISKAKEICCEKCQRPLNKDSKLSTEIEVTDGIIKEGRKDQDTDKSVKMSHIEVYHVDEETKVLSNVIFKAPPIVYEEEQKIGETEKPARSKRTAKSNTKKASDVPKNKHEIVGDREATQGYQHSDEFTVERIHSFVELIKDHPNLIRLFTAGQR